MLPSNSLQHLWENLEIKPQGYCKDHLGQAGLKPSAKEHAINYLSKL